MPHANPHSLLMLPKFITSHCQYFILSLDICQIIDVDQYQNFTWLKWNTWYNFEPDNWKCSYQSLLISAEAEAILSVLITSTTADIGKHILYILYFLFVWGNVAAIKFWEVDMWISKIYVKHRNLLSKQRREMLCFCDII